MVIDHNATVRLLRALLSLTLVLSVCWAAPKSPAPADSNTTASGASDGDLMIDITDILSRPLSARVDLAPKNAAQRIRIAVPQGHLQGKYPCGEYTAYVYVYDGKIPILVDVQEVRVEPNEPGYVLVNVLHGAAGDRPLRAFDADGDQALDALEVKVGTKPDDPRSIPGHPAVPFSDKVLSKEPGWFFGDLQVRSKHGGGAETVAQLVARAEKAKLDFLAITDRNTLAACHDPAFRSDSVVLIPAMEWGSDDRGVALIYGPRTAPDQVETNEEAQALVYRVQAQGGVFAVAHPCFPTAPWKWDLYFPNAIQIWCREWSRVPRISLAALGEELSRRENNELVYSIARAAVSEGLTPDGKEMLYSLSANDQALRYWTLELARGLKASPIAGSLSSSPKIPIGRPVTCVFALEKSLPGILDGMRNGRMFVTFDRSGPLLRLHADVGNDGKFDVGMGGIIPLRTETVFEIVVKNGIGKKLEFICNGRYVLSKMIEVENQSVRFTDTPATYSVYYVRVSQQAKNAFGTNEILAVSSPIYAQDLMIVDPALGVEGMWIELRNTKLPPIYASGLVGYGGEDLVSMPKDYRPRTYNTKGPIRATVPPPGQEQTPQWRY